MRRRWGQVLASRAIGKGSRRLIPRNMHPKRGKQGTLFPGRADVQQISQKVTKLRGIDFYMKEKLGGDASGDVIAKRRRLNSTWLGLHADTKEMYKARARAANDEWGPGVRWTFSDLVGREADFPGGALSKSRAMNVAADHTMEDLLNHEIWSAGANVAAYGTGLRPSAVSTAPEDDVAAAANRVFQYDPRPKDSLKGSHQPFVACSVRCYGLCEKDPLRAALDIGAWNVFVAVSREKLMDMLPLLIKLQVGEHLS